MKRMLLASTLAALMLSGAAVAGPGNGHGHGKGKAAKAERGDHHSVVVPVRVDTRHGARVAGRHDNGLHLGQRKQMWARGQRLPDSYLEQRYYIRDYRQYDLVAPPPGMVWVRPYEDDRRFYLVQLATGIISRIFGG